MCQPQTFITFEYILLNIMCDILINLNWCTHDIGLFDVFDGLHVIGLAQLAW